jgi:hypothetical protein
MGREGEKQKKNPCKQIHASDLFKMREDMYLKKNIHTQLTTWKKNANIKNLPHPSHHFSNGPSLTMMNMSLERYLKAHTSRISRSF